MKDFIDDNIAIILVLCIFISLLCICVNIKNKISEEERKKCIKNNGTIIEKYNGKYSGCIYK